MSKTPWTCRAVLPTLDEEVVVVAYDGVAIFRHPPTIEVYRGDKLISRITAVVESEIGADGSYYPVVKFVNQLVDPVPLVDPPVKLQFLSKITPIKYRDIDGNECTLDTLCRREPEWAANRIRSAEAEINRLQGGLKENGHGGALGEDPNG
jgi:hypothetical protein